MPADRPFALIDTAVRGLVVHAANAAGLAAGVRVGATLADTRAVLPALAVRPAALARDAAALERLAHWLGRYGPARNVEKPDGVWIDSTGVAHLFGGEAALADDLVRRLARADIGARVGIADTHRAAKALARCAASPAAPVAIAGPEATRPALAALPVAALDLAPDTADLLQRLGLKRIGDLYGIPRSALARRFRDGLAGTRSGRAGRGEVAATALLMRLDQALGTIRDPRQPLNEPPAAEVRLPCPEPLLTAAGIEAALDRLAADLARQLAARALGARQFELALYRSDGTVARARVATSAACREAPHIRRLLGERLASLDAGYGIDLVVLAADRLEIRPPEMLPLAGAAQTWAAGDVHRLVDRLAARLGAGQVRRLAAVASHVPERAELRLPALAAMPAGILPPPITARPPFLLDPPEPAEVLAEVPDGAPARLRWRRVLRRIVKAEGPERIAPEWWRHLADSADSRASGGAGERVGTRDYWRLEDDTGAGYWVFRNGLWSVDDEVRGERETGTGRAAQASDADASEASPAVSTSPCGSVCGWFVHGVFA